MKLSSAFVNSVCVLSLASKVAGSSLRGHHPDLSGPFDVLKCSFEGRTDEEKCSSAANKEDKPCSFCSITKDGKKSGLCVDPQLAKGMEEKNPDISCTNDDLDMSYLPESTFSLAYASTLDNEGVNGPFDVLHCTITAKTDKDTCSSTVDVDGGACDFCSLSDDKGNTAGICVDAKVADKMKQLSPKLSCSGGAESVTKEIQESVSSPLDVLKCSFKGRTDEEKCSSAANKEDKPCSFCSITKDGKKSGLCVDPQLAKGMEEKNSDISCTNDDLLNVDFDKDTFKCTVEGRNDADKCSSTSTADEQGCEFCTMNGPFGNKGICVSPEHAEKLQNLGGNDISCISRKGFYSYQPISSKPIVDCNMSGADDVTCLDPSKVNGSECIWCDAGIGGFCFPKSWQETAGKFLKCADSKPLVDRAELGMIEADPTVLTSSCLTVGLHGGSPSDCRKAVDDATGEHCVVCSAPKFGGFGTCMPPKYKGTETQFYACDKQSNSILAQE